MIMRILHCHPIATSAAGWLKRSRMIHFAAVLAFDILASGGTAAVAEVPSSRDVFDLNKIGSSVASISWCSDDSLTFIDSQSSPAPGQSPLQQSARTVKTLSLVSGETKSILVVPAASVDAHCVRGGNFVYVSGSASIAYRPSVAPQAPTPLYRPFNYLVEIPLGDDKAKRPLTINVRWDVQALRGPVLTDAAGNVFGRLGSTHSAMGELDLNTINVNAMPPRQREALSYTVRKDGVEFVRFSTDQDRFGPDNPKIGVYGISTSQIGSQGLASYQCPASAPRPGCANGGTAKTTVYYTTYFFATSQEAGPDGYLPGYRALYFIVPGISPQIQHLPIVSASATKLSYELAVLDVALDAKRCLVLLEPVRSQSSSRIEGRLRLDLLIADCEVKDGRLGYSEPIPIGNKQGSFIFPRLSLRGESVVVTDFYDRSSQEEDQTEFERAEVERARICVHLFAGIRAASLKRTNSLCARVSRLGGGFDAEHLIVSPNAKFIAFSGRDDAVVVGRDYRSNGGRPEWITNGE